MPQDNQPQQFGLFLFGTLVGFKQESRENRDGNSWTQHLCGIEVPKPNGFAGESEVLRLQMPRDVIEQGITGQCSDLIGKPVQVSVWVRAFATRGGAGYNYMLSNDMKAIQAAPSTQQLKKAV